MRALLIRFRSGLAPALTLACLGASAAPAAGQSLLANRGLGLVVEPLDARSKALGGVGLGLAGSYFSWSSPADAVGIPAPGMKFTFQYDDLTSEVGELSIDGSTARFPLALGAFPVGERAVVTVGLGGFLDQNWAVERADTLLVGTDTLAVVDRSASEGGVARIRLGGGYRVLPRLALGVGVDVYTGGVQRVAGRRFPGEAVPGCCETDWTYSGLGLVAAANWTPNEAARLSVAAGTGGTLRAETEDSLSTDKSFDLPSTLLAGASARVTPNLLVALSGEWAGWSSADGSLAETGGARDGWMLGGGLEWDGIQVGERPIPIRLGARTAALPFRWGSEAEPTEWPSERALTSGLGVVLAGGAARMDLALERGWRGGAEAGLEEAFWRTSFSVTVLGR